MVVQPHQIPAGLGMYGKDFMPPLGRLWMFWLTGS